MFGRTLRFSGNEGFSVMLMTLKCQMVSAFSTTASAVYLKGYMRIIGKYLLKAR